MSKLSVPVNEADHMQGPEGAPVTLVQYGDYECDHCGAAYPIIQRLQRTMGDQLRFVFRNFPLTESHPHALAAAQAAEAAARQGKFWEMHDMLYENQMALEDEDLVRYARALELDLDQFRKEFASGEVTGRVEADVRSGIRSGVNGTPTFFINGTRHDDSWDYPVLLAALQEAARKKKTTRVQAQKGR